LLPRHGYSLTHRPAEEFHNSEDLSDMRARAAGSTRVILLPCEGHIWNGRSPRIFRRSC
jgi:hypothetical protein